MRSISLFLVICLAILMAPVVPAYASDHGDSPNNATDRGADLADGYLFLDPNDNTRVVMILTFSGFIVPGENQNFAVFPEEVRYTFDIENTGDSVSDRFYRVTFAPKASPAGPQQASIELPDGRVFTANTTPVSQTAEVAPDAVITEDPTSGIRFWAGLADDPFYFDIPAFGRFVASIRAGAPSVAAFDRRRDSFAGYNVLAIALSVPVGQLRGSAGNIVGMSNTSQRRIVQFIGADGRVTGSGRWVNADRQGLPAINTVTIPFARKNEYNRASTSDDAANKFASDIVATLRSLGTNDANIGILAGLVVTRGDILRLDTSVANTGVSGGTNAGAGFPNGRRVADDVIDTLLFFAANQNTLKDNVDSNDVAFRNVFPFLAPPHQPGATNAACTTRN